MKTGTVNPSRLALSRRLLRLHWLGRRDLAHGLPEGVLVAAGAYLTRRVDELLTLRPGVGLRLLGLWHGANVADLCAHVDTAHVNIFSDMGA
jgi:hypothetical protein